MSRRANSLGTEAGVWKSLQNATTNLVHWTRIEARVGAGVPDLNGAMTGFEFWLELKVVKTVSFRTEGLWRPGQVAWQMRRAAFTPDRIWNLVSHPAGQSVRLYRGDKVLDLNRGMGAMTDFETDLPPDWLAMLDFIGGRDVKA